MGNAADSDFFDHSEVFKEELLDCLHVFEVLHEPPDFPFGEIV